MIPEECKPAVANKITEAHARLVNSAVGQELHGFRESIAEYLTYLAIDQHEVELLVCICERFKDEGVTLDRTFVRGIFRLVILRRYYLLRRGSQSKREREEALAYRIVTIKRVSKQALRDRSELLELQRNDWLESQVLSALVERSCLIDDGSSQHGLRDMSAFDFHLWCLRGALVNQQIPKPVEVIAAVLENSGIFCDLERPWQASTIKNRITKASGLIKRSKDQGACHFPIEAGPWPQINSNIFVNALAGQCSNCREVWGTVLNAAPNTYPSVYLAAKDLARTLPTVALSIRFVMRFLLMESGVPEPEIVNLASQIDVGHSMQTNWS